MKKAFTLIELVVAVALLAMVFAFAGTIFRVSIDSYRISAANAEIMQKMRVITEQLNNDFEGMIPGSGGRINFASDRSYNVYGEEIDVRSDGIIFFAAGDFQSTGQYDYKGSPKTVFGNTACIFYAIPDVNSYTSEEKLDPRKKILMRRQTIIVDDPNGDWDPILNLDDFGEYCNTTSLAQILADPSFDFEDLMDREFNLDDPNAMDLVNYMAKGVDDFTIQYVGDEYPSENMEFNQWRPPKDSNDLSGWPEELYPVALKFTFTLYDSKGIIKEGREFTHIVYLEN